VFYVKYLFSELRRRKGRTLLTAMGLGVGVGLVVAVSALSNGLDDAQSKVLDPLTGVGTDMTVSRPLTVSGTGSQQQFGGGQLSQSEREKLRKENGGGGVRFGLRDLGKPGEKFSSEQFVSGQQLSFASSEVAKIAKLDGVYQAAGSLTLTAIKISGTVPEQTETAPQRGAGGGGGLQTNGPRSIDSTSSTVTGIDASKPAIAPVTPSQVRKGRFLSASGGAYQALLNLSYARQKGLAVGDSLTLKGKKFTIVGLTSAPLGGTASDVYVHLATLQTLAARKGRINGMQVRATTGDQVAAVTKRIKASFSGASVTTSKDLADRIGGSLKDAKNLSSKLGTALAVVALIAAFLIATLLTLSGIAKRTRELGTLKAIGWKQRLVVRQVTFESLTQGLLGGVFGAAIGIAAAAAIGAVGIELKATVDAPAAAAGVGGPGGPSGGPFGLGRSAVTSGSQLIKLHAPVDLTLIALAIGLALLGGLLAGAVGGARAARLRPAEALRSVE